MTKLPTGRHTQAIKAARKSKEKYEKNKTLRSRARTYLKKAREAAENGEIQKAKEIQPKAVKYIDRAVSKGLYHSNKAARLKSRLAKKINNS
ncbi:MAG: 30S ribosomal protein S20 [Elusimicrobiota bacterium]